RPASGALGRAPASGDGTCAIISSGMAGSAINPLAGGASEAHMPQPTPRRHPDRIRQTDREHHLAKPEWGTKRICPSCGPRYYDLLREQVICPKCSTPYDPEAFLKARRSRPV